MSFVSLFLGLVLGTQTVAVQVADPVTRVEIFLDGQESITFEGPPWKGQIDLGQTLVPHELVAVAYDRNDRELDRAAQWINIPRPPAEITILLERNDAGQAVEARISWESLVDDQPSTVLVEFDGDRLDFENPQRIPLPHHDPELLHFLRVEVEFGGIVRTNAEVTFGGTYMDQVNSELTAIPVTLTGRRKLPPPAEMKEWFVARGRPLRVAAVEKGAVHLIVVRDQGAWPALRQVRSQALNDRAITNRGRIQNRSIRRQWFQPFQPGWDLWAFQFLWPVPSRRVVGESPYDLFTHSQQYVGDSGSLHGWLTTIAQPEDMEGRQRLADAVAVAGVTAAGGNRRRGVLLVLGAEAEDASESTPEAIRHYLEALGVPLYVWTLDAPTAKNSPWGKAVNVSTPSLMARASSKIFHELERQRIVWVEGNHLPQQVTQKDSVRGMQALAHSQTEEIVLGKSSSIRSVAEPVRTAEVPAGARLRERPQPDSAVIEVFDSPVELPVLDKEGHWVQVRFGAWLGWVRIGNGGTEERLEIPANPDLERLQRALSLLGDDIAPTSLGPFSLYTDVTDPSLLDQLSAVAEGTVAAYRERFGLDPGPVANEVVVLFAEEKDYRQFEATELRIAGADSQGYTSEGLSILYTGRQQQDAIRSVLIHELTHLLNRRVFRSAIPPWLEEGMAQDLAFCRVSKGGRLRLGTLSTIETHLATLLEAWNDSLHLDVLELLSLDLESFSEPDGRPLRYTESAFLIRFFLDGGDDKLRTEFLRYLSQLTTSELADSVSLFEELDSQPSTIESGLFRFLTSQAKAHGIT